MPCTQATKKSCIRLDLLAPTGHTHGLGSGRVVGNDRQSSHRGHHECEVGLVSVSIASGPASRRYDEVDASVSRQLEIHVVRRAAHKPKQITYTANCEVSCRHILVLSGDRTMLGAETVVVC